MAERCSSVNARGCPGTPSHSRKSRWPPHDTSRPDWYSALRWRGRGRERRGERVLTARGWDTTGDTEQRLTASRGRRARTHRPSTAPATAPAARVSIQRGRHMGGVAWRWGLHTAWRTHSRHAVSASCTYNRHRNEGRAQKGGAMRDGHREGGDGGQPRRVCHFSIIDLSTGQPARGARRRGTAAAQGAGRRPASGCGRTEWALRTGHGRRP